MKYIGSFLRINTINQEIISNQLNFFSRESLKNILLKSSCGIIASEKKLKLQKISNNDINSIKKIAPLRCVYKKGSPRIDSESLIKSWRYDTFKTEIPVFANSLMTICTLYLSDYYKNFKDIDKNLFEYSYLYSRLAEEQLDFYITSLRNDDGFFVDKKLNSDPDSKNIDLISKSNKYNIHDQSFIALSLYIFSKSRQEANDYEIFSKDILNLINASKEKLYNESYENLSYLLLSLLIYYAKSNYKDIAPLILDIADLQCENFILINKIDLKCLTYINFYLLYKTLNISEYREKYKEIYSSIISMFNFEDGIIMKDLSEKEVEFTSNEIILLLIVSLLNDAETGEKDSIEIYKKFLLPSGLILSWPESPDVESRERYVNFTSKVDDFLDDINFKASNSISESESLISPIFNKSIKYSRKKKKFLKKKPSFDSNKEMFCLFMILNILN